MAVDRGFDPLELPPDRFFNWVYHVMTRDLDEKKRLLFDVRLNMPLPGASFVSTTESPEDTRKRAAEMFRTAQAETW